jgi:molybdopterin molybdotransferase
MLTVAQALAAVLNHAQTLPPAALPLVEALGCVLAEDAVADLDSPPFDKALVDGYAVRSSDLAGQDRWLAVGQTIMAGQVPSRPLGRGEAAVVMTGAPIPPECDAVVMHERTRPRDDGVLVIEPEVKAGQNLMIRGREMRAGEVVVACGSILVPARLGVLASVGRIDVRVVPRPLVAIVPTGDELVEPGQVPGPGQIRNSNAVLLQALAIQEGARVTVLPIAPDVPGPLATILERGLESDVLVITGGVSAGQRDLVPAALDALGVTCIFHKVRLKPGKPLWFGIGPPRGDRPAALVFGLPGNPVSGLVGFLLFVKAALSVLAGKPEPGTGWVRGRLTSGFSHRGDRATFFPSRLVDPGADAAGLPTIESLPWHGSADLRATAGADGFAIFAAGDRDYVPGDIVDFLPMRYSRCPR